MNIHEKRKSRWKSKFLMIVGALTLIGVSGGGTYYALHKYAPASAAVTKNEDSKPHFSFSGSPGWWQGATNQTSMALFDEDKKMDCFTSVEYKPGSVDADAELQKMQDSLRNDGYTVTELGFRTLSMQTAADSLQYQLYQSSVTPPTGGTPLKGGQEFGYIKLASGYVKVMGYCDTSDQLSTTLRPLQAIRFDDVSL